MSTTAQRITNPRNHPRVLELAGRLKTARDQAKEAERAANHANRVANELADAAEETEVLAELGEDSAGNAEEARKRAVEAAEAAAEAIHAAEVKRKAVDTLGRLLVDAEREALRDIEARFRGETQELVTELHARLQAAAEVNEKLIALMEAAPAGVGGRSLAWADLRITPTPAGYRDRGHWRPLTGVGKSREGVRQWAEEVKARGYEL